MFNENWNTDVARSYMNLYNEDGTVADAPTFEKKEETVAEPVQLVENPETEEPIEEVVESEETGDFLLGLLEDVQTAVGEELNEQEIEIILETVALVVEGMVQKLSEGKRKGLPDASGKMRVTVTPAMKKEEDCDGCKPGETPAERDARWAKSHSDHSHSGGFAMQDRSRYYQS